jgi:phage gp29-like protein
MFINSDLQKKVMVDSIEKVVEYYRKAVQPDVSIRDARYFLSFLARLPQIDQHLFSLLYFRKQSMQTFSYTIKFPDEYETSDAEKKQIIEMKERWAHSQLHSLLDVCMNGRILGLSGAKLNWDHSATYKHFVAGRKSYPVTDLDFDVDDDDKLIHIDTDTKTQRHTREPFNEDQNFLVRYNPMSGYETDFPGGFIRINFLRSLIKYWDFFNWAKNNEKTMIWAEYEERFKKYLNEIMSQLDNLGESSIGAFPKGVEIKTLDYLKDSVLNSHKELETSVNRGMSLSIAGQYTAADPGDGHSYAASKVGYEIAANVTLGDLVFVEKQINNQYIIKDYKKNYSEEPRNAFPIFEFKKRKFDDQESRGRIITDYVTAGIPVCKEDVYTDVGLKIPGPDDEVIAVNKTIPLIQR